MVLGVCKTMCFIIIKQHCVIFLPQNTSFKCIFLMKINCNIYFLIKQSVLAHLPDCKFKIYN